MSFQSRWLRGSWSSKGPGFFQEGQEKSTVDLPALGSPPLCRLGELPSPAGRGSASGQRRQRNPAWGRGMSLPAKRQGKIMCRQSWHRRFLVCYARKGLGGGFCARKLSVTGPKQLPAWNLFACGGSSALLLHERELPWLSSASSRATLRQSHTPSPPQQGRAGGTQH